MTENCSNCRWRSDLVKYEYFHEREVKTYMKGYACLAYDNDNGIAWMVGNSEFNSKCKYFTRREKDDKADR